MSTTTYDVRTDRHHRQAAELATGDEVRLDGQRGLVARVVPSRDDVMVELWARGAVEHRVHFLAPTHLVETVVGR